MRKPVKKRESAFMVVHLEVPTALMRFLEDLHRIGGSLNGNLGMTPTQYLESILLRERDYILGELPGRWFAKEHITKKYHILNLDD